MNECIDSLSEAKMFSALNDISGYWKIKINNKSANKITFVAQHGLFKDTGMPFGLENAPTAFHHAISVILASVMRPHGTVYTRFNIIFSNTKKEHLKHIRWVLLLLKIAEKTSNWDSVSCLEKPYTTSGWWSPQDAYKWAKTTEAIRSLRNSTMVLEMRSFLALFNVNRRFVPSFTSLVWPLNQKLRKGALWQFEPDATERVAVDVTTEKLATPPVLVLPQANG